MAVKSKKAAAASGDQASDTVLQYLKRQNRPYNVNDLFNNLHGAVGKTQLQKVLAALVDESLINMKPYGKQQVFVVPQDEEGAPSAEELDGLDRDFEDRKKQFAELKDTVRSLQARLQALQAAPTNEQAAAQIDALTAENAAAEETLQRLRQGAAQVDPAAMKRVADACAAALKAWKARKRMFKNAFDAITESYPGKPAVLMEELGIETDEASGVNVADVGSSLG